MARNGAKVTIKDTGPLKIARNLKLDFQVGILPEEGAQTHRESGLTLAELAAIHEFGAPSANIPQRSWLRTWADLHSQRFISQVRDELARMVRTQRFENNTSLARTVEAAAKSIKARILGGHITPKDSKATLDRKAPERRPLVDSKQFVNAIHARLLASLGARRVNLKSK